MPSKKSSEPYQLADGLLEAFAINNRVNEYLIHAIPDAAWRAEPPEGKGRTIAAMVAHMHNVRLMWLKAIGGGELPENLDRLSCTKEQSIAALERSREALGKVLGAALRSDGRVKGFKPDAAAFLGYLFAHDAHHRGQISMLARQLGMAIPQSAMFGMWEWGKR